MKTGIVNRALLIVIHFFFVAVLSGQSLNDSIIAVNKKVLILYSDTTYSISTYKNETFLDSAFINQAGIGFGELTGYFKNGKLCRIKELIGVKKLNDVAIVEYYFSNDSLIYVSESEQYNPNVYVGSDGVIDYKYNKDEPDFFGQYYFNQNRLFYKNTRGKPGILPNEMFFDSQSKQGQLLENANEYRTLFLIKFKQ